MSDRPPSVLFVHELQGDHGGAEVYLERLARGIAARGGDVHALVFTTLEAPGERHERGLRPVETELVKGRATPWRIARAVRRWRPQVMHWNFCDPFSFRGATFTMLPWRRPSVITDHLPMMTDGRHYEITRAKANQRLGGVVVVGREAAQAFTDHWGPATTPVVIPNGVPLPDRWEPRKPPVNRPIRLLSVGRLTDQKRVGIAIDLVAERPDTTLTVAGDGPDREQLASHAKQAEVVDRVTFLGRSDDVAGLMAEHDVFIAPAAYEGLPLTPMEALATGLPVVFSDIGPHRELADPAGVATELVADAEARHWARAVDRIESRLELASEAARALAERSSLDRMIDDTVVLHRSLLGER